MGLHLMGLDGSGLGLLGVAWSELTPLDVLNFVKNVVLVLLGLNFVIFVHELGHFAVAKMCGVKCEKFYIWFDLGGWRLWRFKWGETEYGIGWLPLGGYVKMLGQEDNPARLREEIARAKGQQAATPPGGQESAAPPVDVAAAEQALYDPRSYLAKSVPKRMAIISAGVIMNLIFALLMAMLAYGLGVFQAAGGVGAVAPGEAAWQANLRPGDKVLQIAGKPIHRFNDLRSAVSLGDIDQGLSMVIQRPGVKEPFTVTLQPDRQGLAPTIGVVNPLTTTLSENFPVQPGSAAGRAQPPFQTEDKIVQIAGQPIGDYSQIHRLLALHRDEPLQVVVDRPLKPAKDVPPGEVRPTERVTITVPPQPVCRLGLVMHMGPITAVQLDSPATAAGLKRGDTLVELDGAPVGDPMTLAERLRLRAEKDATVEIAVLRDGQKQTFAKVALRKADWFDTSLLERSPMSAPALGIAYEVRPVVEAVLPGSPAAEAGLQAGDEIVSGELLPPSAEDIKKLDLGEAGKRLVVRPVPFSFRGGDDEATWPYVFTQFQEMLPGSTVKLKLADERTVVLASQPVTGWHRADRGLVFQPMGSMVRADSIAQAFRLGWQETGDSLTMVFRFLHKVGSHQVSWRGMGGPVAIFILAYRSAERGFAELLMFLTMICANLAVINFLPIPVLDGGHIVFLLYEGITGRPADERVQGMLTWLGFLFIVGLMLLVLGLDVGLISRK